MILIKLGIMRSNKRGGKMAHDTTQVQIVKKLNKMSQQLDEVLKRVEDLEFELSYPPESKIRKSYVNKLKRIERSVKAGHVIRYNGFDDFAKDVS